ncbi:MAG TPA: class I SAM-dependent methyltransferase [Kofleriaceae bacterium]|nr:class I SAM-dependent methyltransferase [Kofleriaceae bacterium]
MAERVRHTGGGPPRLRRGPQRYQLDKRGVELVAAGHPWIFRGNMSTAASALADGQWLALYDGHNRIVGYGVYAAAGAIAIRVIGRGPERPRGPAFNARVDAALARRESVRAESGGFRAVHGESDGLPAVTADVYGDVVVVQSYAAGVEALARLVARRVGAAVGARGIVLRGGHRRIRREADAGAADPKRPRILRGTVGDEVPFREGGMTIVARPLSGQKGGGFLDLRGLRRWVAAQPLAGKRVLNLFAYTGTLGLAAEHAGAAHVTQVDRAADALELARRHHIRDAAKHELVTADVFDWLPRASGDFDVVIVDPPSMTSRIEQVPGVLATYRRVHKAAAARVAPGGALVVCCCTSRVTRAQFEAVVANVPAPEGGRWQLEASLPAERDHPVGFAEADYLKIMILRRT